MDEEETWPDFDDLVFQGAKIAIPEQSEWSCRLLGKDGVVEGSVVFTLQKGMHPKWFHRQMMNLFFGFKWVKQKDR